MRRATCELAGRRRPGGMEPRLVGVLALQLTAAGARTGGVPSAGTASGRTEWLPGPPQLRGRAEAWCELLRCSGRRGSGVGLARSDSTPGALEASGALHMVSQRHGGGAGAQGARVRAGQTPPFAAADGGCGKRSGAVKALGKALGAACMQHWSTACRVFMRRSSVCPSSCVCHARCSVTTPY